MYMLRKVIRKVVTGGLVAIAVFLPICVNMVSGDDKVRGKKELFGQV